jgi:hypothetical protein
MGNFFKLDAREFNKTIDLYLDLTNRDRIDELNRRAANICARAASLTPKADLEDIVNDMKASQSTKYLKTTKKRGTYLAERKGKNPKITYFAEKAKAVEAFAIANWRLARGKRMGFYSGKRPFPNKLAGPGKGKKGGTASEFYNKFVKRARSSAGYIAAGWLPAYYHFSNLASRKAKPIDKNLAKYFKALKGSAGLGYGIENVLAAGEVVKAVFVNAASGIGKIGQLALQNAINEEEADMKTKIAQEQQKIADKVNRIRIR